MSWFFAYVMLLPLAIRITSSLSQTSCLMPSKTLLWPSIRAISVGRKLFIASSYDAVPDDLHLGPIIWLEPFSWSSSGKESLVTFFNFFPDSQKVKLFFKTSSWIFWWENCCLKNVLREICASFSALELIFRIGNSWLRSVQTEEKETNFLVYDMRDPQRKKAKKLKSQFLELCS